jgi:selenocysteine lyase/cysteine desulfurase
MKRIVDPEDFPASRKSVYLNTASVTLMYRGAEAAAAKWMADLATDGTITFDEAAEEGVFGGLHRATAQLLNAREEDIAVGSSATELMASLAWAVTPDRTSNIVSTGIAFPSTIYPWIRVARHTGAEVRFAEGQGEYVDPDEVIELIDNQTAVVCISQVEYSGGQQYDLTRLARRAHEHGALLVVDGAQSLGAIPTDVTASGVDALVASGYKWLCGPFGVAVMYLAPHLQGRLDPGVVGFRSHEDMWDLQATRLELPEAARRFEPSTMAYGCAIGLAESIKYLLHVGIARIRDHNLHLADLLIDGLRERRADILGPRTDEERTSIVATRFPNCDPAEMARRLNAARVVVSARQSTVRFSPHLYNEPADIERALEEIDRVLR